MATDLSGKVAAITGASSGIGEATALALADAGAKVALAARRKDRLDDLAGRIGDGALAVEADVADEAQARRFVETTHSELGGLDILVNNAGVMLLGPVEGADTEDWRRMVDVNLLGLLYCTHAALPLMREGGGGHIVNVSSVAGRIGQRRLGGLQPHQVRRHGLLGGASPGGAALEDPGDLRRAGLRRDRAPGPQREPRGARRRSSGCASRSARCWRPTDIANADPVRGLPAGPREHQRGARASDRPARCR